MLVQFISSVSLITREPEVTRKLLVDTLGLPLQRHEGSDYHFSEAIGGSKHFGAWPLTQAAMACFGVATWPPEHPIPQVSIEFEVEAAEAVQSAAEELLAAGHRLLHEARTEPWGQTVCRMLTPDGAILGISFAPWMHEPSRAP